MRTLQDRAGRALDLTHVTKTTVQALRSFAVQPGTRASRGSGVESTVYEVRARLVSTTLEKGDEIHLVIKGVTSAKTMIVAVRRTMACSRGGRWSRHSDRRPQAARRRLSMHGEIIVAMLKGHATRSRT